MSEAEPGASGMTLEESRRLREDLAKYMDPPASGELNFYGPGISNWGGGGSFVVNYPSNVSLSNDAGIYFGLRTPWQEYNPVRGL